MAIEFPAPPQADGTTFTASNGVVYTYDSSGGGGWYAYNPDGLNDVYVNIDGDTMTGDLTVPSLNGGPLAGFRNQIINGAMNVVQRGAAGETGVSRVYTTDRWYVHNDVAQTYTWDQINATGDLLAAGFAKVLRVRNASAVYQFRQLIELPAAGQRGQFVEGSTWTVSCYSTAPMSVQIGWRADSEGVGIVTNIIPATAMTAAGGSRYTYTFTMPATAPDVTALALEVSFLRTDGATSATQITGCQLEPGPVATPFEHRPISTELQLCYRYFRKLGRTHFYYVNKDATDKLALVNFSGTQPFRAVPSITWDSLGNGGAGPSVSGNSTPASVYLTITPTSNNSAVHVNGLELDAEL